MYQLQKLGNVGGGPTTPATTVGASPLFFNGEAGAVIVGTWAVTAGE